MISASILLGFIGFGSLVGARFHPMIYTGGEGGAVAGLYWSGFGVVASQAAVIFMVIVGWYSWAAHATFLAATLILILYSIRTVVRLRRIESEYSKWRAIGGPGAARPGGGKGRGAATGSRHP